MQSLADVPPDAESPADGPVVTSAEGQYPDDCSAVLESPTEGQCPAGGPADTDVSLNNPADSPADCPAVV